jgi:hypothetical protein
VTGDTCRVGQARASERRSTGLNLGDRLVEPAATRAAWPHATRMVIASLLVFLAGCGATQLASNHRHLLEALQTAVSAKNDRWLEAVSKQVEAERSKGAMSDAEFKAFDAIIRAAKAGNWDTARDRTFALSECQRPTADDLARWRERKRAAK